MSVVMTMTFFARIGPLPSPSTVCAPFWERRYPLAASSQLNEDAQTPWNGTVIFVAGWEPAVPPAVGSASSGRNERLGTSTAADPPARFTASRSAGVLVNSLFGAGRNATR